MAQLQPTIILGTGKNNINDAIGTLNQSNQELGNKITNLGDQLQQVFYDTNKRIDDVEKKLMQVLPLPWP